MTTLDIVLFWNASGCYPSFLHSCDQWGEYGWTFDVRTERFIYYTIDRKDQFDQVHATRTRAEFIELELPEASAPLQAWFQSFRALKTPEGTWVLRTASTQTYRSTRLPSAKLSLYGTELTKDQMGRPYHKPEAWSVEDAPPQVQQWCASLT